MWAFSKIKFLYINHQHSLYHKLPNIFSHRELIFKIKIIKEIKVFAYESPLPDFIRNLTVIRPITHFVGESLEPCPSEWYPESTASISPALDTYFHYIQLQTHNIFLHRWASLISRCKPPPSYKWQALITPYLPRHLSYNYLQLIVTYLQ